MRNKRLLATLFAVVLLVLWWFWPRHRNEPLKAATAAIPSRTEPVSSPAPFTAPQAIPSPITSPNPPKSASGAERVAAYLASYRTPISFYGRVVDQHGQAVPEAEVKLFANDKPGGQNASHYERKTNAAGVFSLEEATGITLGVEVSKPGYRRLSSAYGQVTSSGTFEYGLSSQGPYHSSPESPTVFTLYKVGSVEPLVKVGERNFRMARDGSPLSISLDQHGGHEVVLRCWNKELEPRPAGERRYDWRLEISVPAGGLAARTDDLIFEAPTEGYNVGDMVEMPACMPLSQWNSYAARSYFLRFGDGTFARVNLRMRAAGDHFVVWESFFNPKPGSRNLETDPAKEAP